jgi:hypothetical protein
MDQPISNASNGNRHFHEILFVSEREFPARPTPRRGQSQSACRIPDRSRLAHCLPQIRYIRAVDGVRSVRICKRASATGVTCLALGRSVQISTGLRSDTLSHENSHPAGAVGAFRSKMLIQPKTYPIHCRNSGRTLPMSHHNAIESRSKLARPSALLLTYPNR